MHDIVEFVQAVAWPATILAIVYVLLPELKLFAMNFAKRVETDTIVVGSFALSAPLSAPSPPQLQDRKLKFRRYALSLEDAERVDAIAKRLGLASGTTSVAAMRKVIVAEMNRRVNTDMDMAQFSALLKRIAKQDF